MDPKLIGLYGYRAIASEFKALEGCTKLHP